MRDERRGEMQAALALVATVIGAGFASGREVMRFFTVFGRWSWIGCAFAVVALAALATWAATLANRLGAYDLATLCRKSLGGVGGMVATWVNFALIVVSAGAMIAAMGEMVALMLPIHNAYRIGLVLAIVLGGVMASRGLSTIAAIGYWLLPTCLILYVLLLRQPAEPTQSAVVTPAEGWRVLPLAMAYAAQNAAISCGVLCELGRERSAGGVIRACALAAVPLLLLLFGANAALIGHVTELRDAALPIVMRARSLGAVGYWLCIAVLSLAILSTLVAMLRTLQRMLATMLPGGKGGWPLALLLPSLVALTGFSALVSDVYPLLGVASTLLFLAMMFKSIRVRKRTPRQVARAK